MKMMGQAKSISELEQRLANGRQFFKANLAQFKFESMATCDCFSCFMSDIGVAKVNEWKGESSAESQLGKFKERLLGVDQIFHVAIQAAIVRMVKDGQKGRMSNVSGAKQYCMAIGCDVAMIWLLEFGGIQS